jgi:hypothetical protein
MQIGRRNGMSCRCKESVERGAAGNAAEGMEGFIWLLVTMRGRVEGTETMA